MVRFSSVIFTRNLLKIATGSQAYLFLASALPAHTLIGIFPMLEVSGIPNWFQTHTPLVAPFFRF